MMPSETNLEEIAEVMKNESFNNFHLKRELDIHELDYKIGIKDCQIAQDGYPNEKVLASIWPESDWRNINSINFYTGSISDYINRSFFRIHIEDIFREIIDICIKYLLAHELIHILQIKEGRLTKEIFEASKKKDYKEREFEIEADLRAIEIMGKYGKFEQEVSEIVKLRKSLDNENVKTLIRLFK